MFVGHAGPALLATPRRAGPSFWLLLAAAFGPDWLELPFGMARQPYAQVAMLTHSLLAVAIAATLAAGAYQLARRDAGGALRIGVAWLSHWPADLLTARKPTWPGGPVLGLDLYARPGVDLALEVALALLAWAVFARRHHPGRRTRVLAPALMAALQLAFAHQDRFGGLWKQDLLQGVVARVRARLEGREL